MNWLINFFARQSFCFSFFLCFWINYLDETFVLDRIELNFFNFFKFRRAASFARLWALNSRHQVRCEIAKNEWVSGFQTSQFNAKCRAALIWCLPFQLNRYTVARFGWSTSLIALTLFPPNDKSFSSLRRCNLTSPFQSFQHYFIINYFIVSYFVNELVNLFI